MNEFDRYVCFTNLFDYYKDTYSAIVEYEVSNLMRVLWGQWDGVCRYELADSLVPLVDAVTPYATNCARFCDNATDFMTVCNGLRNAYLDGSRAQ